MSSLFILALGNIKRRRMQSLLLGSCIALAALLFATTLGLIAGMHRPFDRLYEKLNASHLLLHFDQRQQDTEQLRSWFDSQPEVERVGAAAPYFILEQPIIHRGNEIDLLVQLTEHQADHLSQDQLLKLQGSKKLHPGPGEIWIPGHLAASQGIILGDTLGLPTPQGLYPLVVTATVIDPQYASPLFNPTRAWVGPGSLLFFSPLSQVNGRLVGIRLGSAAQAQSVLSRYKQQVPFVGNTLQYDLFKSAFLSFYQILSLVLLIFSILAILATVLILNVSLLGNIVADTRLIGLLKVQGLTPANVRGLYLLQYLVLTSVSLPVGILGSYFLTIVILTKLAQSAGLANLQFSFTGPVLITAITFLLLSSILTYLGSRRAGRIRPVEALRDETVPPIHVGRFFSGLLDISLPVFLGWRLLIVRPKRVVYTGLCLLLTIFLLVFSINISHSLMGLKENRVAWGLEDSDLQLRLNREVALPVEHGPFLRWLQGDTAVAAIVPYSYCTGTIMSSDGQNLQDLVGKVYTASPTEAGLQTLQGRYAQGADEIALCTGTATEIKKGIGDVLDLFIEGQRRTLKVSGIYQDIGNLGRGFRLDAPAISELNPLFEPERYAIRLKEGIEVKSYQEHLQRSFGETVLIELSVEDRHSIQTTLSGMRNTLMVVALFFLLILFIVLFEDMLIQISEFHKDFGILKTIGMTPVQLRKMLVYKSLLLGGFCLLTGIPLALLLSPVIMNAIAGNIGLAFFPYLFDGINTLLVVPAMLLFAGGTAWFASKTIFRIKVRVLVDSL